MKKIKKNPVKKKPVKKKPAKKILHKPRVVTLGFDPWISEKKIEEMNNATKGLNDSNKFFNKYPLKTTSSKTETPENNIIDNRTLFKLNEKLLKTISLIENRNK